MAEFINAYNDSISNSRLFYLIKSCIFILAALTGILFLVFSKNKDKR